MCFELGSCFGNGRREDFGGQRSTTKAARAGRGRGRRADHRNGYYSGTDHKAPPAYQQQPHTTAVDKAGHNPYHEGAWKDHRTTAVADAGIHGGYAAYVQDKADYDTLKLPAWHNKVGDEAGKTYTARLQEAAADYRENAPMNYHQYPTTTVYTTMVRY